MLKPYLTEKSISKNNKGVYVFTAPLNANKHQIKNEIETTFKVKIEEINTQIKRGKIKRFKGKVGAQKTIKKAIFTLVKGQTMPGFESEKKEKKSKTKTEKATETKDAKLKTDKNEESKKAK